MKVSRKVGRRSHCSSSVSRRRLRNKNSYRKKHTQQGGKYGKRGRGHKRARTHKRGKRFHRGGLVGPGPSLHQRDGGIVEVFLLNSAYLGEYELTYSTSSLHINKKDSTKKFRVYYQPSYGVNELYLLRLKDEKFRSFLCLDTHENAIIDLEKFDTGKLDNLKFKSLDIETAKVTGKTYTFSKNNKNNIDNFGEILDALLQPAPPIHSTASG